MKGKAAIQHCLLRGNIKKNIKSFPESEVSRLTLNLHAFLFRPQLWYFATYREVSNRRQCFLLQSNSLNPILKDSTFSCNSHKFIFDPPEISYLFINFLQPPKPFGKVRSMDYLPNESLTFANFTCTIWRSWVRIYSAWPLTCVTSNKVAVKNTAIFKGRYYIKNTS